MPPSPNPTSDAPSAPQGHPSGRLAGQKAKKMACARLCTGAGQFGRYRIKMWRPRQKDFFEGASCREGRQRLPVLKSARAV